MSLNNSALQENILKTVDTINKILNKGEQTIIFDVGHYIKIKGNYWKYNGIIYGYKTIVTYYQEKVNKAPLKLFNKTKNEFCPINDKRNEDNECKYEFSLPFTMERELAENKENIFKGRDWASFLKEKQIFCYMLVSSYVEGDHHSAVWVIINGEKPDKNQRRRIYHNLNNILLQTLLYNTESYYNDLRNNIKKQAVRTSLSQVMARNLSHNIGSHVLAKVSTLKEYKTNEMRPFLMYLNNRMDYIADITTSTPVVEITKNLKYDIIKGYFENILLKENISASDNFDYEVIVGEVNDPVSIPNDVLGMQAFYTILENIIRNTAKHSKVPKGGKVIFKIQMENVGGEENNEVMDRNEMLSVSIVIEYNRDSKKVKIKKEDTIWKEAEQNTENGCCEVDDLDWLIYQQNSQINTSVLVEDDSKQGGWGLRQGGWGLLEMEASAAYLRKIPMEEIEEEKFNIKILKDNQEFEIDNGMYNEKSKLFYLLKAYKAKENHLAYRFFLSRPHEILFIGKSNDFINDKIDDIKQKNLLKQGIKFVNEIEKDTRYPHRLVFYKDEKMKIVEENIKTSISPLFIELKESFNLANEILYEAWEKVITKNDCIKCIDILNKKRSNHASKFGSLNENDYCQLGSSINSQWEFKDNWSIDLIKRWCCYCKTTITVIDERIQEFAQQSSNCKDENDNVVDYSKVYHHIYIYVPPIETNLKDKDFDEMIYIDNDKQDKISEFIKAKDSKFVVIHLGIIEKLIASYKRVKKIKYNKYNKDNPNDIKNFIKDIMSLDYNMTVIVSGRSKPSNLPKDIRYLNYSIISQYLINKQCKYSFAEVIYSSRSLNHR